MAVVRTGMATAVTTGTGAVTATLSAAQAPVGSLVIATYTSTSAAATVQTGFTNTNPSFTVVDLAGPTGASTLIAAKIQTEAGVSCTTNDAGTEKRLNLQAYIGHDGSIPSFNTSAQHIDTGNMRTSATAVNAGTSDTMVNGPYDGSMVQIVTSYLRPTSGAVAVQGTSGNAIDGTFTNPTNGTNPTNPTSTGTAGREMLFNQDTSLALNTNTGRYGATMSNTGTSGTYPLSIMAVLIKADPGIVTQNTNDSSTISDSASVSATNSLSDSATVIDTATASMAASISDTQTQIEGANPLIAQTISETHTLSNENATVLQILYATGSDSIVSTDNATLAATMLLSETYLHIDTASVSAAVPASDTLAQSDSASIAQEANADAAIFTEGAVQINQTISETHNLTDTARIHLNTGINDTHRLSSENASTNRNSSDTHRLSSEIGSVGPQAKDSATLSESATVFVWVETQDDLNLFDIVQNLKQRVPTFDDQITYGPAFTKPRKPFRVLAQNIFTKEWIHNDLPLSDELITTRVSGPGNFKGVFNTEIRQVVNLNPGLIPGATWLHVEEDGEIRQSTILQPFIDSTGEQKRQVEGIGFSSYLNQVFYQGEEYKKVQIDPAEIIRYIWAHAQSFPTAKLGVVVSNTVTPVRLGTEPKNVEFENGQTGENVAFEAGPYDLNWWEVTNLGTEFEKLCKETPIEYYERSYWNADKTDVLHRLELGYPRVGNKRDPSELIIREGENLQDLIPEYSEDANLYPSDVIVIGAGEGPTAIRGYASQITGRLRHTVVLENEDITSKARADAIAKFELNRRTKSRYSIKRVTIDTTHINTPWGSFMAGDDVQVEGTVRYVGKVQDFHRITEIAYSPRTRVADCSLSPSSSFSYGAVPEVEQ